MNRKETGALGEKLAASFLAKRGYSIIEKNFRCREGEIDIIARQADCVVFVEVRSKHGRGFGTPEESVTETKKQHLRAIVARYCETHPGLPGDRRIDFVAVELDINNRLRRIELIENAVEDSE